MRDLLRFDGASEHDPGIEAWFADPDDELLALARRWFDRMRACGDDVLELLHDGFPNVLVHDAPFAYVNAFKAHVNVGFFRGAELDDPDAILVGTGKLMRHVKLRPDDPVDEAALERLIDLAYVDIKARLGLS